MVTAGGPLYALGLIVLTTQESPYALVAVNASLGFADAVREPASMAAFADEGKRTGSVASAFAVRQILWRPGMVLAPMIGGSVLATSDIRAVFYVALGFTLAAVIGIRACLFFRTAPQELHKSE